MPIRISGLNSGLDTDSIVKELVNAYSLKTQKYEKQKTKLEWKQDAWKSLNTKIYGLYTNVSNLRYSSAYNMRKTTVSNAAKASVTASDTAVTGTQKLNILQNAQAAYMTGAKLGEDVKASTKLSELGFEGETKITVESKVGGTKEITVNADTTLNDFVTSLKDAGLNASFDANNKRLFISAKESGAAHDFDLKSSDDKGASALGLLGLASLTEKVDGQMKFTAAGAEYAQAHAFFDTDKDTTSTKIKDQVNAYLEAKKPLDEAEAKKAELQKTLDAKNAYEDVKKVLSENPISEATDSIEELLALKKDGKLNVETLTGEDMGLSQENAEALVALSDKLDQISKYEAANKPEGEDAFDWSSIVTADVEAGIAAQDAVITEKKNSLASDYSPEIANIANLSTEERDAAVEKLANRAVEANKMLTDKNYENASGATKIFGQDAQIRLNNVLYESTSNTFNVNGLTIDALGVTGEGDENAITITTTVDTQGIYDKIKDFLTEYNNVVNEMAKLYNAETAKGYEPLTDEEKDAMSESEIEKWEEKIKASLLRRDSSLDSIMSTMVNAMSQSFTVNGEKLSLGNFGIQTLGFLNAKENEQYAYHIDGDEDDETTSGKKDKLMAAIQEDPDQICEFMKQLTSNLYQAVDKKMKSSSLSSAYKVYNDKEMDKQMKEYNDLIKKWEDKVKDQEDYYFDKFSQMEVALSKLQSQTNSLAGLLGQ